MSSSEAQRADLTQAYMYHVDGLRPKHLSEYDFGEFFSLATANDSAYLPDLLPKGDGFFVAPQYMDVAKTVCRVEFDVREGLTAGREDSRNSVFFGSLALRGFCGSSDYSYHTVAVKPFARPDEDSAFFLANEILLYSALDKAQLDHPDIVGLLKNGNTSYMVTRFRPEVITLDSIDWKNLDTETTARVIKRALTDISVLHKNRISHGDAKPRNLTIQPDMESAWFVDLEHGSVMNTPLQVIFGIKKDLNEFYNGFCSLNGVEPSIEEFINLVVEPYERSIVEKFNEDVHLESASRTILKLLPVIVYELRRQYQGEPVKHAERVYLLEQKDIDLSDMSVAA